MMVASLILLCKSDVDLGGVLDIIQMYILMQWKRRGEVPTELLLENITK